MTHTHSAHGHRPAAPVSTIGLLRSLAGALPASAPLARKARRIADRLASGAAPRAVHDRAADLLCDLLNATDSAGGYPEDGLLDDDFDAL